MKFSNKSLAYFAKYQAKIDIHFNYLQQIQAIRDIDQFLKNPIQSRSQLYQAYLEYLWIIERLLHPKDKAFFKPYFLPINGYLEGYFDLESKEFVLFQAAYVSIGIGDDMDWSARCFIRDSNELNRILDPGSDFKKHFNKRWEEETDFDLGFIAQEFLKRLETGWLANTISTENLKCEGKKVDVLVKKNEITLRPVTGLAHSFLPETEHRFCLKHIWCEHFELLYLFELCEADILPLVKDLNALAYTNQFLGISSEKSYSGVWYSSGFGRVRLDYKNQTMSFKNISENQKESILAKVSKVLR